MLKIVDGRSGVAWALADPEQADVLLVGDHSDAPVVERWAQTDKPLIAVHEGRRARPMTPYTLRHPFRVMQLLGVLDDVEHAMEAAPAESARGARGTTPWSFAESLRAVMRGAGRGRLYAAGYGEATVFVRDDGATYCASPASVERLAREWLPLPALESAVGRVPDGYVSRPLFELAWFAGWHGPPGLAPWLEPHGSYHLRRWPDFGLVRAGRAQLAMAAALTRGEADRARLCGIARQQASEVDRFLNACSLAGLLVCNGETAHVQQGYLAASAARFGGLIRGLRLRLGLAG